MKKITLFIVAVLAVAAVTAQPPKSERARRSEGSDSLSMQRHHERQEKIQARKVAYFTNKLELTPGEAQVFWPVYNEYWKKRDRLFMERQNLLNKIQSTDVFDDKKARQVTQRLLAIAQDEANLLREYDEKFVKLLPPKKLLKYYAAEESFKMVLINDLRKQEKKK